MVSSGAAQWALSLLFAATASYHLYGLARMNGLRPALDDALHVLASVAMIAMVWPWGMAVPVMVYIVVFTAAMLWFVARALFVASPAVSGAAGPPTATGQYGSRAAAWYSAAMAAAMIWMAVVMSVLINGVPSGSAPADAMPGMDMGPGAANAGMPTTPPPVGVRVPCLVLAVAFAAAAVWLIVPGLRDIRLRRSAIGSAVGGLMAAGMAFAFLEMAAFLEIT